MKKRALISIISMLLLCAAGLAHAQRGRRGPVRRRFGGPHIHMQGNDTGAKAFNAAAAAMHRHPMGRAQQHASMDTMGQGMNAFGQGMGIWGHNFAQAVKNYALARARAAGKLNGFGL